MAGSSICLLIFNFILVVMDVWALPIMSTVSSMKQEDAHKVKSVLLHSSSALPAPVLSYKVELSDSSYKHSLHATSIHLGTRIDQNQKHQQGYGIDASDYKHSIARNNKKESSASLTGSADSLFEKSASSQGSSFEVSPSAEYLQQNAAEEDEHQLSKMILSFATTVSALFSMCMLVAIFQCCCRKRRTREETSEGEEKSSSSQEKSDYQVKENTVSSKDRNENDDSKTVKDKIAALEKKDDATMREDHNRPLKKKHISEHFQKFEREGILIGMGKSPKKTITDVEEYDQGPSSNEASPLMGFKLPSVVQKEKHDVDDRSNKENPSVEIVDDSLLPDDDFSAVVRETSILRSYRKAAPPGRVSKGKGKKKKFDIMQDTSDMPDMAMSMESFDMSMSIISMDTSMLNVPVVQVEDTSDSVDILQTADQVDDSKEESLKDPNVALVNVIVEPKPALSHSSSGASQTSVTSESKSDKKKASSGEHSKSSASPKSDHSAAFKSELVKKTASPKFDRSKATGEETPKKASSPKLGKTETDSMSGASSQSSPKSDKSRKIEKSDSDQSNKSTVSRNGSDNKKHENIFMQLDPTVQRRKEKKSQEKETVIVPVEPKEPPRIVPGDLMQALKHQLQNQDGHDDRGPSTESAENQENLTKEES